MLKLHARKEVTRRFLYYSFLTGIEKDAQNWSYDNVRLPALNWQHALKLYIVLNEKTNKTKFDLSHTPVYVQKVIEFEHIKMSHTQWHFKFLKAYTPT